MDYDDERWHTAVTVSPMNEVDADQGIARMLAQGMPSQGRKLMVSFLVAS
jgi:hypothetical protein